MASQFECGICAEDKPDFSGLRVLVGGEDKVCINCFKTSIVPEFKTSIEEPSKFPYYWGTKPLRFQDYEYNIPKKDWYFLISRYKAKQREFDTPRADRIYYYADGSFVGSKYRGEPGVKRAECPTCQNCICMHCGGSRLSEEQVATLGHDPHVCIKGPVEEAYTDQQRGKDYQLCPACDVLQELKDGCNTVFCRGCRAQYCSICGEAVLHKSDHWARGKPCPRYNQPGAENARFDGEGFEIVDDVFIPEEEDLRLQRVVVAARDCLRPIRDRVDEWLRGPTNPETHALLVDFRLMLQNLINNYGFLDFAERADIDMPRWIERNEQIHGSLLRLGGVELINSSENLWDILKKHLCIRFDDEHPLGGRPIIDMELRREYDQLVAQMRFGPADEQ